MESQNRIAQGESSVRSAVLRSLRAHEAELASRGVSSIAIFGSVARAEDREDSDVDILVGFDRPIGLFDFVRLQARLEALLGRSVDLATVDALRESMRDNILREAIHVR